MKPLTREWIAKAEADFRLAVRESRRRAQPNLDAVCFAAQQCVEKYLKAQLQECGVEFRKTHDLEALGRQLAEVMPSLLLMMAPLKLLSTYAVVFRYPGRSATRKEALEAVGFAKRLRQVVRESLGLPRLGRSAPRRTRPAPSKRTGRQKGRKK